MKYYILSAFLVLFTMNSFSQNKKNSDFDNILATYNYHVGSYSFPEPFTYNIKTTLFISNSLYQYKHIRETKVLRDDNYQTEISFHKYINNYYPLNDSIVEQRTYSNRNHKKCSWKNDIEWEFTDETKEINGYLVKKAITKSFEIDFDESMYYGNAYAWYTEEIPIPAGPGRYYGLPGLILELSYENSYKKYTLESLDFNVEDFEVEDLSKGKFVKNKFDIIYF